MGSQVPQNTVRFDASFGRRLLHHPDWLAIGLLARHAWMVAHLIATEFDGRFHTLAVERDLNDGLGHDVIVKLFPPRWEVQWSEVWESLEEVGMIEWADEDEVNHPDAIGWYRIVGWEKWQPDPLERRTVGPQGESSEERKRRLARERKQRQRHPDVTQVTQVTQSRDVTSSHAPVTPHARASSSSSSSLSERVARTRARGDGSNDPTTNEEEAIKAAWRKRGLPVDAPGKPHVLTDSNEAV